MKRVDIEEHAANFVAVPSREECLATLLALREQCGPRADPLVARFRFDQSCRTLEGLRKHGVRFRDLESLARAVPVVFPWQKGAYAALRGDSNALPNVLPYAIVMAERESEVRYALRWARRFRLPISLRAGAHSYHGYSLVGGGIVIDQSRRRGIRVDESTGHVAIEPGVLLGPLTLALSKFGLALPTGTCPNVGATGLALGGGIGFLNRQFGLTLDALVAVRVLLASGRTIDVDAEHHRDLWFAMRGAGGGSYGIVTALAFQARRVAEVLMFQYKWPFERAAAVLYAWQRWAPFTTGRCTMELDLGARGEPVEVSGLVVPRKHCSEEKHASGDLEGAVDRFLARLLRAGGEPATRVARVVPYVDAARFFGEGVRRKPFIDARSAFIGRPLSRRATEALVEALPSLPDPEQRRFRVEFNAFGGAINDVPNDASAFPHRRGTILWCQLLSHWTSQADSGRAIAFAQRYFYDHVWPASNRGAYVNVPDVTLRRPLVAYYGRQGLRRLVRTKRRYDPDDVFRFGPPGQSVPPVDPAIDEETAREKEQSVVVE